MGEKPTIQLRVYKGGRMLYDENGNVLNENQIVTLKHDTKEWELFLKHLKTNNYSKVVVEKCLVVSKSKDAQGFFVDSISDTEVGFKEIIQAKVDAVYALKEEVKTREQLRIEELERKLELLLKVKHVEPKAKKEAKAEIEEAIIEELDLHAQYREKFAKEVPNNKKNDEDWIKAKLTE